jgi:hypothetical protein
LGDEAPLVNEKNNLNKTKTFGVDILIQRGGKAIRTKMILFDEDSLKQEILGLFIHKILIQTSI